MDIAGSQHERRQRVVESCDGNEKRDDRKVFRHFEGPVERRLRQLAQLRLVAHVRIGIALRDRALQSAGILPGRQYGCSVDGDSIENRPQVFERSDDARRRCAVVAEYMGDPDARRAPRGPSISMLSPTARPWATAPDSLSITFPSSAPQPAPSASVFSCEGYPLALLSSCEGYPLALPG